MVLTVATGKSGKWKDTVQFFEKAASHGKAHAAPPAPKVGASALMILALLVVLLSVFGCMTMEPGGEARGPMTVLSEAALFRVSIQSDVDPIPINSMHAWTLHVEDRSGQPIADAQ